MAFNRACPKAETVKRCSLLCVLDSIFSPSGFSLIFCRKIVCTASNSFRKSAFVLRDVILTFTGIGIQNCFMGLIQVSLEDTLCFVFSKQIDYIIEGIIVQVKLLAFSAVIFRLMTLRGKLSLYIYRAWRVKVHSAFPFFVLSPELLNRRTTGLHCFGRFKIFVVAHCHKNDSGHQL